MIKLVIQNVLIVGYQLKSVDIVHHPSQHLRHFHHLHRHFNHLQDIFNFTEGCNACMNQYEMLHRINTYKQEVGKDKLIDINELNDDCLMQIFQNIDVDKDISTIIKLASFYDRFLEQ